MNVAVGLQRVEVVVVDVVVVEVVVLVSLLVVVLCPPPPPSTAGSTTRTLNFTPVAPVKGDRPTKLVAYTAPS